MQSKSIAGSGCPHVGVGETLELEIDTEFRKYLIVRVHLTHASSIYTIPKISPLPV